MGHFLHFYLPPPIKQKKKIEFRKNEKKKKMLEISSFYICVPKITIILGMVPEIWSETTEFFVILGHFVLFYAFNNLENENFEKMKKVSGEVIISHICNKNHDHMMYASWAMECDRQNFVSFWVVFCHFTPLMTLKFTLRKN